MGLMVEEFTPQLKDSQFKDLSFEDRFSLLVDAEWPSRKRKRLHWHFKGINDLSRAAYQGLHECQRDGNVRFPGRARRFNQ